jgi:glycosyltransferase involved in cell wall biosynthesis
MIKVSVITVVKDHASGLRATFNSIQQQIFVDWELILVVAESSDGTLPLAKSLASKDPRIKIICQNGFGIYQAMNEGLNVSSGEFTWFLNAGDTFSTSHTLTHAVLQISAEDSSVVIGGYSIKSSERELVYSYTTNHLSALRFAFNRRGGCHQAMIFRSNILKRIGGFNTLYSLASDFDLVLRIILESKVLRVHEIYASIEPGGRADQSIFQVHKEKHQIRRELLGGVEIYAFSLIWTYLARIKIGFRKFIEPL